MRHRPCPSGRRCPAACDVAIIGAGYTGLRAALTLLRAGRSVAVFDKEDPGFGASRRNAGYLGRTLKKSFDTLAAGHGADYALAIYRDLDAALQSTLAFIATEGIDCHAVRCGRFIAATSPHHYEVMAKELASMKRHLGFDFAMVPKAEQHQRVRLGDLFRRRGHSRSGIAASRALSQGHPGARAGRGRAGAGADRGAPDRPPLAGGLRDRDRRRHGGSA